MSSYPARDAGNGSDHKKPAGPPFGRRTPFHLGLRHSVDSHSASVFGIPSKSLSISRYIAMSMRSSGTQSVPREAPVHLEGLGKDYGHFTALKSLELTVPQGTSFGFLGPNGAGKSTTIKLMTNLIRPSRGRGD